MLLVILHTLSSFTTMSSNLKSRERNIISSKTARDLKTMNTKKCILPKKKKNQMFLDFD